MAPTSDLDKAEMASMSNDHSAEMAMHEVMSPTSSSSGGSRASAGVSPTHTPPESQPSSGADQLAVVQVQAGERTTSTTIGASAGAGAAHEHDTRMALALGFDLNELSEQPPTGSFTRKTSSSFSDLGDYDDFALSETAPATGSMTPNTPTFYPIYEEDARCSPLSLSRNSLVEITNTSHGRYGASAGKHDSPPTRLMGRPESRSELRPRSDTEVLAAATTPVAGEEVRVVADSAAYIIYYKSEEGESGSEGLSDEDDADSSRSVQFEAKPPRSFTSLGAAGHQVQTTNCFTRDYTHPTRSLGRGLFRASTSVGSAFLKGAAGLVNQTYQGGANGGVFGFAKGLGMGMLGLGTHTVKGAFRGVGQVTNVVGEMVLGSAPHFSLDGTLLLTNYRIIWQAMTTEDSFEIPVAAITTIDSSTTAPHVLNIECKSLLRASLAFRDETTCYEVLSLVWALYSGTHYVFAHDHFRKISSSADRLGSSPGFTLESTLHPFYNAEADYRRLKLLSEDSWMRLYENHNYALFPTYPEVFVIPSTLDGDDLRDLSTYRSASRIPAVVWKHPHSGALVTRCAQPCAGLSGYVVEADRKLVSEIQTATRGEEAATFHFYDARSQMAAAGNAAQGKGTEDPRNYPNTELHHCDIGNIHAVRSSFVSLSSMCQPGSDRTTADWAYQLRSTFWFLHISRILISCQDICRYLCQGESAMIHCSDGWDRTPQMTTLVQLLLDPYYRTLHGFLMLIEKEWCSFGHMFRWRYAHGECPGQQDHDEQSPVFVQWLDAVWQIWRQQPWAFEFNEQLLEALYLHVYSGLFGNFLYNCEREKKLREEESPTRSLWFHLMALKDQYVNVEYDDAKNFNSVGVVLPFSAEEDELVLWEHHVAWANPVCRKYE